MTDLVEASPRKDIGWYNDLFSTLQRSDRFKLRWGERGHIHNRYFKSSKAGVRSALQFVDDLLDKDIVALGLWFQLKSRNKEKQNWKGTFLRRCHSIEDYPLIFRYFLQKIDDLGSSKE